MSAFLALLESWGYWGMFVSALIAGTVFPFSSEIVLSGLQLAGLDPLQLFIAATVGNTAGSMINYWVGSLGKMEWIEKYLHVKASKVEQASAWMERYGAWIGLFSFVPIVGSAISVALGFARANAWMSFLTIFVGKAIRYSVLIYFVALF
ncbi:MAG: DedA family protein [Bacteroidaceae bacterium]|nr:DedA family protein [Bacteroidaceae bacterium]MBQ9191805.1 DedA family protein [Bacteroidaceae bacterium]MBQ9191978.1 DedA family protein [Bacteroidaceae bacterium]